jgi:TniQ
MRLNDRALILPQQPRPDESGMGFCLRTLHINCHRLQDARRWLEMPNGAIFTRQQAKALASFFGVEASWLEPRLASTNKLVHHGIDLHGHRLHAFNHHRRKYPQVCSVCLMEDAYCRASWDLSLSTVCTRHQCLLVDACPICGKRLTWERPAVDVGYCGHYLSGQARSIIKEPVLLELQSVIQAKFNFQQVSFKLLPSVLEQVSLGAFCMIALAFGLIPKAFFVSGSGYLHTYRRTREWHEILARAGQRMTDITARAVVSPELTNLVAWPCLERVLLESEDAEAHQAVMSLMTSVFDLRPKQIQLRYACFAQQKLF